MANEATRNVNFKLRVEGDQSIGRTFNELGRRIAELQQQMNLRLTLGGNIRRVTSSGSSPYVGNGSTSQQVLNQREQSERTSSRRIAEIRRASDERMRIEAEVSAKLVEKANRESLDQQIKDLRKSEAERQKILEQTQREREKQLRAETKSDADYWKDFSSFGQRTKKEREAGEQLKQRENRRRTAEQARENDVWRLAGFGPGGGTTPHGTSAWSTPRGSGLEDLAHYGRASRQQRQRQDREAEMAAARQREAYARLRETISGTTDAVTRLSEGMAYLGLIGQHDLGRLTDTLLAVRGGVEGIRGLVGTVQQIGAVRGNLAAAGGRGALGRAMLGLGPAAGTAPIAGAVGEAGAGAAGGAGVGTGAVGAAGGVSAGAVALPAALVAALAAGGMHLLSGGRSTREAGRFAARRLIGLSHAGHWMRNVGQTMFMDADERRAWENQDRLSFEDVNDPRGRMSSTLGTTVFDSAAANERNTRRLSEIQDYARQQRERRIALENNELPAQFSRIELEREQRERRASIGRQHYAVQFQHAMEADEAQGGLGIGRLKKERGQLGRQLTELDVGLAGAMERGPLAARLNRQKADYARVAEEQSAGRLDIQIGARERQRQIGMERSELEKAMKQNEIALARYGGKRALPGGDERVRISGYNPEGAHRQSGEEVRLLKEQETIRQKMYELSEKQRRGEIGDATKLVQLAQQRMQIATQRVNTTTEARLDVKERLGAMNPMMVAAMARARDRGRKQEELTMPEIELLQSGDAESQSIAHEQLRRRGERYEKQHGFSATEEQEKQTAIEEQTAARKALTEAGSAPPLKGEVEVGGSYNITIDIRDDMQLAEQLKGELTGIDDRLRQTEARVMQAVRAAVEDMGRNIQMQGRPPVGASG